MDVILNGVNSSLYVADFHLSPISSNIPYTYKSNETLLNNSHQDNVKAFYKTIQGHFYNEGLDPEFNHNWPIITNDINQPNIYSNMYDMGCKRAKHYNIYNKQLEFFCPIWIEKLNKDSEIEFKLTFKGINDEGKTNNATVASKVFSIKFDEITDMPAHDAFTRYMYNYINDAGLFVGSEDVFNISFKDNNAIITGLDASTGIFTTKHIDSLIDNITLRERPLLEVDNMLINSFINNTILCKQLFNFNLCFDLKDFFTGNLLNMMAGEKIGVSITVSIDGEELEMKDFYSEYEYLPKYIEHNAPENVEVDHSMIDNVFDYLNDNNYIDFIAKNKYAQNIIHWSLSDNNDYIFNVYNGFSGLFIDYSQDSINPQIYENTHHYKNTPNTALKFDDDSQNTTGWLNIEEITKWSQFYKYVRDVERYKVNGTKISKDTTYIHNLKYSKMYELLDTDIYILGMVCTKKALYTILEQYGATKVNKDSAVDNLYVIRIKDLIILISTDRTDFAFGKMYDTLKSLDKQGAFTTGESEELSAELESLKFILDVMLKKVDPTLIMFGGSLLWTYAHGPSKLINEVSYIKDNASEYVFRYDGNIKPTFVSVNENEMSLNRLYYKDFVSDITDDNKNSNLQSSRYKKYMHTDYEPLYPSIDYCSINSLTEWNYKEIPMVKVSESIISNKNEESAQYIPLYKVQEYSWFNDNIILVLLDSVSFVKTIEITDENRNKTYKEILDETIYSFVKEFYHVTDSDTISYIISKYNINNNWNYVSDTNIKDYIYNIKMTLK